MAIIQIREDANQKQKSKPKAGGKNTPAKKKGAGKTEVPSDQKLDEKVTKKPTGDK